MAAPPCSNRRPVQLQSIECELSFTAQDCSTPGDSNSPHSSNSSNYDSWPSSHFTMTAASELSWGDLSEQPATAATEKQSHATATAAVGSHTEETNATSQPHTAHNVTSTDSKPAAPSTTASTASNATSASSSSTSSAATISTLASAPTTTDDVSDAADQLSKTSVTNTTSQPNGKLSATPSTDDHDDSDESNLHPNDHSAEVQVIGGGASIYKAAESFESLDLSKELLQGVYDMKFTMPSKIQARALPIILDPAHSNLIGQAQHGSGKVRSVLSILLALFVV